MKKHISALLALSMILLLSACGGQSQSQDPSGSLSSETPESSQSGNEQQSTQSDAAQEFLSSITPETAEAKGVCGADLYWYYQDNVLVIKGTGEMTDYSGSMIDLPWRNYEDEIGKVVIGEGCTTISDGVFENLDFLSSMIIPNTVTYVGSFTNSREMKSVIIPASVTKMRYIKSDLEEITFLGDAPEITEELFLSGPTTIYYHGAGFEPYMEATADSDVTWIKQ